MGVSVVRAGVTVLAPAVSAGVLSGLLGAGWPFWAGLGWIGVWLVWAWRRTDEGR